MRSHKSMFRRVLAAGVISAAVVLAACDATERLLEAEDPDLVNPDNVQSADGAEAVRLGAMRRWVLTTAGPNANGSESTWLFGGLLVDEWGTASTFVQNDQVDTRRTGSENSTVTAAFRALHRVRTMVNLALPLMETFRPTETTKRAELYLARAFAEMQLASDFCNGLPLSNSATPDGSIFYGDPLTVDSVFKLSIITADSGIALATVADTQTTAILNALRVIKARSLLATAGAGAGRAANYNAAAALAAAVPATFAYNHTFSLTAGDNGIWGQPRSNRRYLVGDSVEGNGRNILVANAVPFFSSNDNRIRGVYTVSGVDTTRSQDGLTNSRITDLYGRLTNTAVANHIDARLIEAEVHLFNNNPLWLTTLNALRATAQTIGAFTTVPANLPPLVDPGTQTARENLLFREKAFWTFSRGHRLGDLRRLVRQYGRASNTVYPEGTHYRGGTYGPDLQLPIPDQEANNPKWTGCTDRNA